MLNYQRVFAREKKWNLHELTIYPHKLSPQEIPLDPCLRKPDIFRVYLK